MFRSGLCIDRYAWLLAEVTDLATLCPRQVRKLEAARQVAKLLSSVACDGLACAAKHDADDKPI
jgi:hypothetical protein